MSRLMPCVQKPRHIARKSTTFRRFWVKEPRHLPKYFGQKVIPLSQQPFDNALGQSFQGSSCWLFTIVRAREHFQWWDQRHGRKREYLTATEDMSSNPERDGYVCVEFFILRCWYHERAHMRAWN